eukprot:jgi/Botrbrau1/13909/Bobra.136_2s0002.1
MQLQIDQQLEHIWRNYSWVGAAFEPVVIDVGGSFRFGIFKMAEGRDSERLLVRGSNARFEDYHFSSLLAQAYAVQVEHDLLPVTVTLEAVGVMEWQGDTNRDLYIHPTTPVSEHEQKMLNIAAGMVSQALPGYCKVKFGGPHISRLSMRSPPPSDSS